MRNGISIFAGIQKMRGAANTKPGAIIQQAHPMRMRFAIYNNIRGKKL